jgi:hypothetical protein
MNDIKIIYYKLMKGLLKVSFYLLENTQIYFNNILYQFCTIFLLNINIKNGTGDLTIKVDNNLDKIFII